MTKKNEEIILENTEEIKINEGMLSWAGKIFFAGVAAYLAGVGLGNLQTNHPIYLLN